MSSANEGVDLELADECLGIDDFLTKFWESEDLSPLPSVSECGCDGELDLCEIESTVEAGEGGARDSDCFPGAVPGRLSGALRNLVEAFSFSLVPLRLYHLSFPIPSALGDAGSTEGSPGVDGMTSYLFGRWGVETLAGDDVLPEADEFADTEAASGKGFLSLLWPLILTEGTCRNG